MTVRSLREGGSDRIELTAPVCVVGAGIAGLLLALRLARQGTRVVVLESGGRVPDAEVEDLNRLDEDVPRFQMALTGRARGLGGSSSRWGGRMLPFAPHDFEGRPELSIPGWPIASAELDRYRPDIEALFGVDGESYEEELLDHVDRARLFPKGDSELTTRWPKWSDFRRCNLAILLRREIEERSELEIWTGATATDFEASSDGRLVAILARNGAGRTLRAQAAEFVLAAGTIESTRLLLSLDRATAGHAFDGCDALGRYFADHLSTVVGRVQPVREADTNRLFGFHFIGATRRNLHLEMTAAAQRSYDAASGFAQVVIEPPANSPLDIIKNFLRGLQQRRLDLTPRDVGRLALNAGVLGQMGIWRLARKQLYLPRGTDLLVSLVAEQAPRYANRITLSDKTDVLGMPVAKLDWTTGDVDERTLRSLVRCVAGYWERAGFDRLCPIEWAPGVREERVALAAQAGDTAHPSGSARMGTDPASSVVKPDLTCHAVPNLTVASAAVFPRAGSSNPTFTIMQLAMRAADAVAARLR